MTKNTTKDRLAKWEALLNRIKAWETTSNKKTVDEMFEDLLKIRNGCDVLDDNDGFLRAEECLDFMRKHFHKCGV